MIGVAVRFQVGCTCGRMVPINALVTHAQCPACQRPVEVALERWQSLLQHVVAPDAAPGKTASVSVIGSTITLDSVREDPRCARCQTALPDEAAQFAARGFTMCPGCGAKIAVRSPPESLAPALRGASLVCGEELDQLAQTPPTAPRAIELRCASCSAPLSVDGTQRTVRCAYCSTDVFLPDDVWLRMHPIAEVAPFYLCWASRDAIVAAALRDFAWSQFRDAVVGPDGNLYCAGVDRALDRPSLWCMTPELRVIWKHDDVAIGDSKARLAVDGRRILLWQRGKHSALAFAIHDGAAIGSVGGEEPAGATVHHMDLDRASSLCADPDGTLLALIGANLVRFAGDGTGIETWLPKPGMFGLKHDKLAPLYNAQRDLRDPPYVDLAAIRDRPAALSSSTTRLHVGGDGSVFAQHGATAARFDRVGRVVYRVALPTDNISTRRIGSDAAGNCYTVGTRPGPYPSEHVLVRISPDGKRVDVIATDHAHGGPVGASDDISLAVAADGTCFILGYGGSARVIAPDGSARYISKTARDDDARDAVERAKRS